MSPISTLADDTFAAFLKCRYKAHLKLRGAAGEPSEYERLQARLAAEYRLGAQQEMLRARDPESVIVNPPLVADAIQRSPALIVDATVVDGNGGCRLDALERSPGGAYTPILFIPQKRVAADDRLRLAFGASILARVQGVPPETGRIIHGPEFRPSRVNLPTLSNPVREAVDQIRAIRESATPPPLMLNRHCAECEFRRRCRAAAVEKDDLSLLGGLTAKEIAGLNGRGVFTVTQYAFTFRPGRMKRAAEGTGRKHDHSLQALAIREKTAYVAHRPVFPDAKTVLYLDVEGLPDEDFYYLVGLTVVEGGLRRHLSFWADGKAEEASIWASFLTAVGPMEDFILLHYGSYESHFFDRMEARHGGDPGLIARLKDRSVNVLSLIYSRVYFPVHSNDLKSVAGCLGFRWSAPDASGLQSIVWRHDWEETQDESRKQLLIDYNREDCLALEQVVEMLQSLGGEKGRQVNDAGPRVAGVEEAAGPYRHRFGTPKFALPEFARITKCAYFEYQRDKVRCRTSPRLRKIAFRKGRPRPALRVNQELECGRPSLCPHCGSTGFDQQSRHQKLVIDLKPFRGGIKRWVTRYKAKRYRCRKCVGTFLPEDYLRKSSKYGRGLCGWIVYSSISLRQTQDAVAESLDDLFGISLESSYLSKISRRIVEHYRSTYDSLLSVLRKGSLVHADETKVKIKGSSGNGYVWVFASPETVVYAYAPTRDGDTARETLAGFKGVLVSDFYAAYDSLDCPQQKCLIHLIRDFNDDLLKNPFDNELKQQAARFTILLQAVVETIDRYGLKQYHLNKHKKDADRYYEAESRAAYESQVARHYQQRVLKNRHKLFTFLDHDGVPWNNNNAENAVKRFVSRRKTMGTSFTEAGIRDYLLLLSIYQTLRYRNASFWRFLLSGETDIAAFTANSR